MTRRQHIVAMALFVAANVALHAAMRSRDDDAPAPSAHGATALTADHYEPASDLDLANAFASNDVVVCIAAETESGCA